MKGLNLYDNILGIVKQENGRKKAVERLNKYGYHNVFYIDTVYDSSLKL